MVNVRPASEPSVSVPLLTVSVTVSEAASTSPTLIRLAPLKASVASSVVEAVPGAVFTGASLTAITLTATVTVSVTPPDVTV